MFNTFMWNQKKEKRKQHIQGPDGRTWCKCENGGIKIHVISQTKHPEKPICRVCLNLIAAQARRKKKSAVKNKTKEPPVLSSPTPRIPKYDLFLKTWEWKQVRYKALNDSDGKCQCCGRSKKEGVVLNVDHIKPRRKFPELALTQSNLQILCHDCNHGKGNWDETDWREPRLKVLMGEEMAKPSPVGRKGGRCV